MTSPGTLEIFLTTVGSAVMFYVMLKSIGQTAIVTASGQVLERRASEKKRREEDALAEAAGRAAALEPLNVNPDGSIEEPIVATVEVR